MTSDAASRANPAPPVPHEPSAAPPPAVNAAALLVGGLLVGLVLILPLRAMLSTTTYGALYAWLFGAVAAVVAIGLLLGLIVPRGLALAAASAGVFAASALVALYVAAAIADTRALNSIALVAGLPAAAVAAAAGAVIVTRSSGPAAAGKVGMTFVAGFGLAAMLAPGVGDVLSDRADQLDDIEAFEESGLAPYVPEIGDLEPRYSSTFRSVDAAADVAGYQLDYLPTGTEPHDGEEPSLALSVGLADTATACVPVEGIIDCRAQDGYVVVERSGVVAEVYADLSGTRLQVDLDDEALGLASVEEIGEALADAEESTWDEVVSLED